MRGELALTMSFLLRHRGMVCPTALSPTRLQIMIFQNSKSASLYHQRKKSAKLHWTQVWRRMNKKGSAEASAKRRTKRVTKFQRAIVGVTLEEVRRDATQRNVCRLPCLLRVVLFALFRLAGCPPIAAPVVLPASLQAAWVVVWALAPAVPADSCTVCCLCPGSPHALHHCADQEEA